MRLRRARRGARARSGGGRAELSALRRGRGGLRARPYGSGRRGAARLDGDQLRPDHVALEHEGGAAQNDHGAVGRPLNKLDIAVRARAGAHRDAVRGLIGLAGPYDFLPLDGPITRAAFGGAADLGATQPVTFAGAGDPPALLLHGAKDDTVYPRNSNALARKLNGAGVRADVVLYDGVGHVGILTALSTPLRDRAPVLSDAIRFAREVTGQSPEPR